jgi:hypothetical protein
MGNARWQGHGAQEAGAHPAAPQAHGQSHQWQACPQGIQSTGPLIVSWSVQGEQSRRCSAEMIWAFKHLQPAQSPRRTRTEATEFTCEKIHTGRSKLHQLQ